MPRADHDTPAGSSRTPDWSALDRATAARRRREYRETTPGQRIDRALELSELAKELRSGLRLPAG